MNPDYADFFERATGRSPYPFQDKFASGELPWLVDVPTGLGKTAMVVVGWLWRRLGAAPAIRAQTPRRLVYCLPMRTLVEQVRSSVITWLENLELLAGTTKEDTGYRPSWDEGRVPVLTLMGGEEEESAGWRQAYPEREAIIVGTQDMLLSRALNRAYAASRSRWPMLFGALHTDCLWVFDEVQLMGAGLETSAQLEAFRRMLPREDAGTARDAHGCRSLWMSATLDPEWLRTVDLKRVMPERREILGLDARDREDARIAKILAARKPLQKSSAPMGDARALAEEVEKEHKPGTRTIVVLNTVDRARKVFAELRRRERGGNGRRLVLLHSRFRPGDRMRAMSLALEDPPPQQGTIVVSTQVVEAGVDVSATTLFTEVAPWASLVQRFGRCNRRGEDDERASIRYILPPHGGPGDALCAPYARKDLEDASEKLADLADASPSSLPKVALRRDRGHVLRRKDVLDLFDTTPDLSGNDIDIDRFVRDVDESDVRVFWRDCGGDPNARRGDPGQGVEPGPVEEELCPAPIGEFREFLRKRRRQVRCWSFLDDRWKRVERIAPGQVFLVDADAGGYEPEIGWNPRFGGRVSPLLPAGSADRVPDATDSDDLSRLGVWQTIEEHTELVAREVEGIIKALELDGEDAEALRKAARWHDRGKSHPAFRAKLREDELRAAEAQGRLPKDVTPAKAPEVAWVRGRNENENHRPFFRHELASALAVLAAEDTLIPGRLRDLVAYLVAAHHGKVRLSIRSLPNEQRPERDPGQRSASVRFARGVWDGDRLPVANLGDGVLAPAIALSLDPMELGLCQSPPFSGQPSWADRMIRLRDRTGPFRLAYLELLLRAADIRASAAAGKEASHAGR